jgi:SpoVK/Ycf46/Vps4 family AAA+-type ATPase
MASSDQIRALFKTHLEGDDARFLAIAMQVAAAEARKGHGKFATELRAMIDAAKATPFRKPEKAAIPINQPRGELTDLLAVDYPKVRLADMILQPDLLGRLERILKEQRHIDRIKGHGLNPRQKLLLTGPPGSGKTLTASVLAGELGIPLFTVRLDGLITKYLGETTAKLRLIFDAVENTRAVYFFDEFDSIGAHRGMTQDVGEIRRVLNSFLMYIEQVKSSSLILAATNQGKDLDYALFRRFDDILEYHLPDRKLIARMLKTKVQGFHEKSFDWDPPVKTAEGLSFAEISKACEEALKEMILHDNNTRLRVADLVHALQDRTRFRKSSQ